MTRSNPLRIACLGEVMIELVAGSDDTARLGVAGDTYNTAVYLRRLLAPEAAHVQYVTAIGADALSDRILDHMKAEGLDTAAVERREHEVTGLYSIVTDDSGERSFTYWRSMSAARRLFSAGGSLSLELLEEVDLLYLSAISLAILPPAVRAALHARIIERREAGMRFAFDSNYRPALWESQQVAQRVISDFWRLTDIALPSVDDEMALFNEQQEASVLERLAGYGVSAGALKRGAEGPLDLSGSVTVSDWPEAETVRDTTAAGDSFNAGFLAAHCLDKPVEDCLRQGHQLASRVIQQSGAIVDLGPDLSQSMA